MTSLFSTITKYDPYFVGFKHLFERMAEFETMNQPSSNYPPYNIIQDDDKYTIELAVAGFKDEDISIVHEPEHGRLTIEGSNEHKDATYLHKGIGGRNFKRVLNVADTIVVNNASLDEGILTVDLENVVPEEQKPKKIEIKNKNLLK